MVNESNIKYRLLLIEDDEECAELIREILNTESLLYDFDLEHCYSVKDAIGLLKTEDFDILLLDLNLGETKGIASFHAIHKLAKKVPIIVIASFSNSELEYDAIKAGAEDFIPKNSINYFNLSRTIFHAIERRKLSKYFNLDIKAEKKEKILPKILVVDDRDENIISMNALLKHVNAEVISASSGNEALSMLLDHEFALVLLDVQMPEMDGFETAYLIRKNIKTSYVPIIFVTAINKEEKYVYKGYEFGAIDYLFKPIDHHILLSKVNIFINLFINKKNQEYLNKELSKAQITLEGQSKQLETLLMRDTMTMLDNRYSFEQSAEAIYNNALRHNDKFVLMLFDIDNFKWINDKYGHNMGDEVLQVTAHRLKKNLRAGDIVARIGGDEFAVILNKTKDDYDAGVIAEKILSLFKTPAIVSEKSVLISVSIGITYFPNKEAHSFDTLFKQADIAMYKAKEAGRGRFEFFSDTMLNQYRRLKGIESELVLAAKNNEFTIFYQPVYNYKTDRIAGLEALLRWNSKKLGVIPPDEFIQIAEKNSSIHEIGLWVLKNVCMQIEKWKEMGIKDMFYAVNFSPMQLEGKDIKEQIKIIISDFNVDPADLEFELTESALGTYLNNYIDDGLLKLDDLNINISIDDFGTGHSSLNRISRLELNTLKIDGSFVREINTNPKNNAIIKSIIFLAKSLSMRIVAECVETKEQADYLLKNGCYLHQGYYFYKPMPTEEVTKILLENQSKALSTNQ